MTLTQLEIFSELAICLNFTSAAQRLGISQSGVSHAIKSLEVELDVKLFHRQQNRVELTDIGGRLLTRARTTLSIVQTMRQEAADAKGMKQGTLRIGSFGPTSSLYLLPRILDVYREKYPDIEIHIDEAPDQQVNQWLNEHRVDIGFVVLPEEAFDVYPLFQDQMVALLPSDHPLAQEDSVTLKALSQEPFALTGAGSGELVTRLFLRERLQPNIRYRTSQLLSIIDLVARGHGVSIVAESALPCCEQPNYAVRPLSPPIQRSIGLAVKDSRVVGVATKAFLNIAQQLYSQSVHKTPSR